MQFFARDGPGMAAFALRARLERTSRAKLRVVWDTVKTAPRSSRVRAQRRGVGFADGRSRAAGVFVTDVARGFDGPAVEWALAARGPRYASPHTSCITKSTSAWQSDRAQLHRSNPLNNTGALSRPW
jgi:hypothetical protein